MAALAERTTIQCIKIVPATGAIRIERIVEVVRDGQVIAASVPAVQEFGPEKDLSALELEPSVLAIAAAVWTPEQITASVQAMFSEMRAQHQSMQAEHDQRLADLERSRKAVAAAHAELDVEHATLAERAERITADRTELFVQSEGVRELRDLFAQSESARALRDGAASTALTAPPAPAAGV